MKNLWSSFANEHAMVTVPILIIGGLFACFEKYTWWPIGIYTLIIGVVVLVLEYPKSGKPPNSLNLSQTTRSRPFQHILGNLFAKIGFLYTNYCPRSLLYIVLSIPSLLTLSTILPGLNLLITGALYLISFFKKESWLKIEKKEEIYRKVTVLRAPERPPPRTLSEIETYN